MHKGIAVSPGVVVGVAYRVDSVFGSTEPQTLADPSLVPAEIERFDRAVSELGRRSWKRSSSRSPSSSAATEADIFKSHIQIVNDQALLTKVRIADRDAAAHRPLGACSTSSRATRRAFARIEHDYFRERLADVRDVISRIGSHLTFARHADHGAGARSARRRTDDGAGDPRRARDPPEPGDEPRQPADRRHRDRDRRAAPATRRSCPGAGASPPSPASSGSPTTSARATSWSSTAAKASSSSGPTAEATSAYRKMQREFFDLKDKLVLNRDQPAMSADGSQIELLANINNVADAQAALQGRGAPGSASSAPSTSS